LAPDLDLILDQRASHHLITVLRAKVGFNLSVFNGDGFEYRAKLIESDKKTAKVKILSKTRPDTESALITHIAQAVSRGERMDYMVQKATELGANVITPILSSRVVVKLDTRRWQKKIEHWKNIAVSAAEQSYRVNIPEIEQPLEFADYVKSERIASRFILDTEATDRFSAQLKPAGEIAVLIGAEGGFEKTEISLAVNHGFKQIGLGSRVLRTETVAPVSLALIQSLWGDL